MRYFNELLNFINSSTIMKYFPKLGLSDITEIIILTVLVYYIIKSLRNTRAWVLMKGVAFILAFYVVAEISDMKMTVLLFQNIILFIAIAVIVVIQPELRRLIETLGTKRIDFKKLILGYFKKSNKIIESNISDKSIQQIVSACESMSKVYTGALIVIEGKIPLTDYIDSGIQLNADITSQLLLNIFEKNTPLHDGAIIIRKDKIIAATCYLPLSDNKKINKKLGTRHRAGIGITEVTDSIAITVSEETGSISIAYNGNIKHNINTEKLVSELNRIQKETQIIHEISSKTMLGHNLSLKIMSFIVVFIAWVIVISQSNPIISKEFYDIPIKYINTESVTDTGVTYNVTDDNYVNVVVTDRKDIIDGIKSSDFEVVADFSKLSYVNAVPLEVTSQKYTNTEFSLDEQCIRVLLEEIVTSEVDIEINEVGQLDDKLYISDIELSANTLLISGAKTLINTIDKVVIDLDLSKLNDTKEFSLKPTVYDRNGAIIDESKIKLNHYLIDANVKLYNTKKVKLNVNTIFTDSKLEELVKDVEIDNTELYIAGSKEELSNINEITIDVPIDIGIHEIVNKQFIKNIPLQSYVDTNINLVEPNLKINITINFDDFYTSKLVLNTEQLDILNLNNKYTVDSIKLSNETLELISYTDDLKDLSLEDLDLFIDMSEATIGENKLAINLKSNNIEILKDCEAIVVVKKAR